MKAAVVHNYGGREVCKPDSSALQRLADAPGVGGLFPPIDRRLALQEAAAVHAAARETGSAAKIVLVI